MYPAHLAAEYLSWSLAERGLSTDLPKLQALLFYAQAYHLGLHDAPLIDAEFEAGAAGPAILGLSLPPAPAARPPVHPGPAGFLDELAEGLGPVDGATLADQARSEPPYLAARASARAGDLRPGAISEAAMGVYYGAICREAAGLAA